MELWEEDLYELIGVSSEATPEEIKKAYKKLAIELHPDRYPDDEVKRADATERFGRITNAYNVLKDEEERAEYDFARRMGFGAGGGPMPPSGGGQAAAASSGPAAPRSTGINDASINEAKRSQAENQFEQGKVYHKAKNWQKAINCYKESIRLDPSVADYHAHLGLAYKQQGLNSPANSAFSAAFKIDKKNKILKEYYEPAMSDSKDKKGGKGKKDAKGGGSLIDQIMAMFGGGGKKDAKGKKGAPAKKGTAQLKKAPAKK